MSCSRFTLLDAAGERTLEMVLCWVCASYQTMTPHEPELVRMEGKSKNVEPPLAPMVALPCENCGLTDEEQPPRGEWHESPRFYRLPFTPTAEEPKASGRLDATTKCAPVMGQLKGSDADGQRGLFV